MAVFRVEKSADYTVMSNHHLRNTALSLKAKGLLSQMLSLPEEWDYTLEGLASINKEGVDSISSAVRELEKAGYIRRNQTTGKSGQFGAMEYIIYEQPVSGEPFRENPVPDNPGTDEPVPENPGQLNKDISSKDISKRKNKKKSQKGATAELSLDELKPVIEENVRRIAAGTDWSRETMNLIYCQLVDFYSPRPIKDNKSPPMKSSRGVVGLCNKLMRESGGDPQSILNALDDAVAAGWITAHAKKSAQYAPARKPDTQLEGKRWL